MRACMPCRQSCRHAARSCHSELGQTSSGPLACGPTLLHACCLAWHSLCCSFCPDVLQGELNIRHPHFHLASSAACTAACEKARHCARRPPRSNTPTCMHCTSSVSLPPQAPCHTLRRPWSCHLAAPAWRLPTGRGGRRQGPACFRCRCCHLHLQPQLLLVLQCLLLQALLLRGMLRRGLRQEASWTGNR